jgi:hypothetical protein
MTHSYSSFFGQVLKGILAGVLYILGAVLTGTLFSALHIPQANFLPPGADPHAASRLFLLVTPLLGVSLVPLARHTTGSRLLRGLTLSFLIFIALGVTAVLEMRIFLTVYAHGGAIVGILNVVLPALLCGFGLSLLLPPDQPKSSASQKIAAFFTARSFISWAARFVLAVLAFAVIYFFFGMIVAPFVVPFYRAGVLGLVLPPFAVILPVLFIRSVLFLLACSPFVVLWTRSRLSLILSLGFAFWFLTGLFGLLQVSFWPAVMRIAHSLEIGADSFAYAATLVFLLVPRDRESAVSTPSTPAPVAPVFPL